MTLIVGLTGGIGSGKSTVAKMFHKLYNIPVYYTDIEAKKIMATSKIIKRRLIAKFGEATYNGDKLNRAYLANLVFTNKENLTFLESIVHPKVNQHFKRWVKKQTQVYILQENAILFENGSDKHCNYIITVTAPKEMKISRVISRDGTTTEAVENRMNNQWSDQKKIEKSNFNIENIDFDKTELQVVKIHNQLIRLAKKYELS